MLNPQIVECCGVSEEVMSRIKVKLWLFCVSHLVYSPSLCLLVGPNSKACQLSLLRLPRVARHFYYHHFCRIDAEQSLPTKLGSHAFLIGSRNRRNASKL